MQHLAAALQQRPRQQQQVGQGHQAQPPLLRMAGRGHTQEATVALGGLAEAAPSGVLRCAQRCIGLVVGHPALALLGLHPAEGVNESRAMSRLMSARLMPGVNMSQM